MPDFPQEPIGAEAAIAWHLRERDRHEAMETEADAMDYRNNAKWHRSQIHKHDARLKELETQFPETFRICKLDLDAEYNGSVEDA